MKKFLLFSILLVFMTPHAQSVDDLINKIDLKLRKDKKYLHIQYINFQPDAEKDQIIAELPRSIRKPYQLKFDDAYSYTLVFLKEGLGISKFHILYLDEIKRPSELDERLFAAVEDIQDDTSSALSFRDIEFLRKEYPDKFEHLNSLVQNYLVENIETEPPTLLAINPDNSIRTDMGITSLNNYDFLQYSYINEPHWYPKESAVQTSARRRDIEQSPFRVDLSFSRVALSYSELNLLSGGFALEVNTMTRVLNLYPWQSSTVTGGVRTLLKISDFSNNIYNSDYIDIKLMYRHNLGNESLAGNIPFGIFEKPKYNVGSAFIFDLTLTRPFGLPFINLYAAVGQSEFKNPTFIAEEDQSKVAYYTFNQGGFSMSFLWNTSDSRENRFKLDLGVSYYDMYKANLNDNRTVVSTKSIQSSFFADVTLNYNFVPEGEPLLGGSLRYFDGRITLLPWIRIVKFSDLHSLRFETIFITSAITRSKYAWEVDEGALFQLRYRFGL